MNRLRKRIESAKQKWEALHGSEVPVIYVGAASCGRAAGAVQLISQTERFLKENKVPAQIVQVGCIGPCYLEPLVDVQMPGGPRVSYNNVTTKSLVPILQSALVEGQLPTRGAIGHFGRNPYNGIPAFFELPMLKPQVRVVLRNCGLIDPDQIDHYLAVDGYLGLDERAPDDAGGGDRHGEAVGPARARRSGLPDL